MRWADDLPSLSGLFAIVAIVAIVLLAGGLSSLLKRLRSPWRPSGDAIATVVLLSLWIIIPALVFLLRR